MNVLSVSGIVVIVLGAALALAGIIQCAERMKKEDTFLPADAEILSMEYRKKRITWNFIPIIAVKEFRPVIGFNTAEGRYVEAVLPYSLKISGECSELFRMYESRTPIIIKYDPADPTSIRYHSKRSFFVREALYKFTAAAVLVLLGAFMIWINNLV